MRRWPSVIVTVWCLLGSSQAAQGAHYALPPHAAGAVKRLVEIKTPLVESDGESVQLSATIEQDRIALVGDDAAGIRRLAVTLVHPDNAPRRALLLGSVALDERPGPAPAALVAMLSARITASGVSLPWITIEEAPSEGAVVSPRIRHDWTAIDRLLSDGALKRARAALSSQAPPDDVLGAAEYAIRLRLAGAPAEAARIASGREAERAGFEVMALKVALGAKVRMDAVLASIPPERSCDAAQLIGLYVSDGDAMAALRVAEVILTADPACGEAAYRATEANLRLGRLVEAEALLAGVPPQIGGSLDVLRARVYLLTERGEHAAARLIQVRMTLRRALGRGFIGAARMSLRWLQGRVAAQVDWWREAFEAHAEEGREARDGRWCPSVSGLPCLMFIPGGAFSMGAQASAVNEASYDATAAADEGPVRLVNISAMYAMQAEVDTRSYAECVRRGGCSLDEVETQGGYFNYGQPLRGDHPINGVTWGGAARYCAWMGARLPTEAEWEYLARGPDGRRFPWGAEPPQCDAAGSQSAPQGCPVDGTRVPGILRTPSALGLDAMGDGVWEWVADWYGPYDAAQVRDPEGPVGGSDRVQRGGAFSSDDPLERRAAYRASMPPQTKASDVGFRCVKSATP